MTDLSSNLALILGIAVLATGTPGLKAQAQDAVVRESSMIRTAVPADSNRPPANRRAGPGDEERGRHILSTAFVRIGPGGYLTVEERDGRQLILRDVTMHTKAYCGRLVSSAGAADRSHCGKYANVVAARPGSGTVNVPGPDMDGVLLDRPATPKTTK